MSRSFTCSTDATERRRTVQVIVYEEVARLRAAAARYAADAGPNHFADAEGVAHAGERISIAKDGSEVRRPWAGIIRLWRQRLTTEVISHEATHVALSIYRQDWTRLHGTPDDGMEAEEILCYLVGQLTAGIVAGLHRHGYYEGT